MIKLEIVFYGKSKKLLHRIETIRDFMVKFCEEMNIKIQIANVYKEEK